MRALWPEWLEKRKSVMRKAEQARVRLNLGRTGLGLERRGEPRVASTVLTSMIKLAIMCLVVAAIAAILGFGGVAGAFVDIAVWIAIIAVVLFVVFLLLGIFAGKKASDALD
ncbi:DUF1328 domain-containing protein [Alteriqipengyuania abyssalis]